jgi:hypothetical protein
MLFAETLPPGVIDFTPDWRPKEYALAVLVVDAITWEDATANIFSLVEQESDIYQYLLRAALFRTLVTSEFYRQYKVNRLDELPKRLRTLDIIKRYFVK